MNRDGTHNLALSLDQESDLLSFGIWDDIPFSWATEADKDMVILNTYSFLLHEKKNHSPIIIIYEHLLPYFIIYILLPKVYYICAFSETEKI